MTQIPRPADSALRAVQSLRSLGLLVIRMHRPALPLHQSHPPGWPPQQTRRPDWRTPRSRSRPADYQALQSSQSRLCTSVDRSEKRRITSLLACVGEVIRKRMYRGVITWRRLLETGRRRRAERRRSESSCRGLLARSRRCCLPEACSAHHRRLPKPGRAAECARRCRAAEPTDGGRLSEHRRLRGSSAERGARTEQAGCRCCGCCRLGEDAAAAKGWR